MHGKPSAYLAFLLDYFIQVACITLIGIVLLGIGHMLTPANQNRLLIPIFLASVFAILFGYRPYF